MEMGATIHTAGAAHEGEEESGAAGVSALLSSGVRLKKAVSDDVRTNIKYRNSIRRAE